MIRSFNRSRLKFPIPSFETLNYQFLQRCAVSGTPKGKIKAAQPLKRNKIPKKKGAGGSGGEGRLNEAMELVNKTVESCLNAPTPVRYLTPKEKEREAEREKLGLISKERQRELDVMKAKKSDKSAEDSPGIIGTPGLDLISLGLVDPKDIPKYELTVEDGRRLAKECSRVLMRQHRERRAAESTLLRLKKEAIEALPDNLKAAALVPDLTPFPANRFMATLTPPIEGYIDKIKEAARKSIAKEKLR